MKTGTFSFIAFLLSVIALFHGICGQDPTDTAPGFALTVAPTGETGATSFDDDGGLIGPPTKENIFLGLWCVQWS